MRIKWLIGVAGAGILCILTLYSGISHSGITGSAHDLSMWSTGGHFQFATEQVCVFCHTPHGANRDARTTTVYNTTLVPGSGAPLLLWNRELATMPSFIPYTSSTMYQSPNEIRIYSLLCLSCHDGVTALNSVRNPPDTSANPIDAGGGSTYIAAVYCDPAICGPLGWGANIGDRVDTAATQPVNLSNDHPVSFDYPGTTYNPTADAGLYPANVEGFVQNTVVKLFPNPQSLTTRSSLECSTCHDVHNDGIVGDPPDPETSPKYPFLVMSKDGSALCCNCHLKCE